MCTTFIANAAHLAERFFLALLETPENAVYHWRGGAIGSHQAGVDPAAAALFFNFFAASQCGRP
jgi:hypothetical protein